MKKSYLFIAGLSLLLMLPGLVRAEGDDDTWNTVLKTQFFAGKTIAENDDVITLEAPYRAEDPAIVPLSVTSKFPQTKEHYIKKICR
jgi:sulfur-oxidizing protein SoxY